MRAHIVTGSGKQVELDAVEEDRVIAHDQLRDAGRGSWADGNFVAQILRRGPGREIAAGIKVVVRNRIAGEEALITRNANLHVAVKTAAVLHIHD